MNILNRITAKFEKLKSICAEFSLSREHFNHYHLAGLFILPLIIVTLIYSYFLSFQSEHFSLADAGYDSTKIVKSSSSIPEDLQNEIDLSNHPSSDSVSGLAFIAVNSYLINRELISRHGWTPNDLPLFPTYYLDNNMNFQMGVRSVYLRSILTLRENLSRQDRTTSPIEPSVAKAYEYASNDPNRWWFPAYENKLKDSVKRLNDYASKLKSGKSGFYPRADTLVKLNEQYASILGSVATSLMAKDTSMFDDDDRFYFAKGVVYAMYENYLAVFIDFDDIIVKNDAKMLLESIVVLLKDAYFEPSVVLSGDIDSWRANHLRTMVSNIYSARQKINSMNSVLLHRGSSSGG